MEPLLNKPWSQKRPFPMMDNVLIFKNVKFIL